MLRRLGYVAIALASGATTNRTCRLQNATPARLRELIAANLAGLRATLEYNVSQDIHLYRISSQLVPFASHPVNRLAWWEEFAAELAELGALIRHHDLRVSMHPGQYTVLGSPRPGVVEAAVAELAWHARLLDALGTGSAHKIVLHLGGAYGDRDVAVGRFVAVVAGLPAAVRRRLALEHDEHTFAAEEVLAVARRTGLPVIFDWLHHAAHPGTIRDEADLRRLVADCFATWGPADGVPKVHLSSQAAGGRRGRHAEWVEVTDLLGLLRVAPARPFDCMLEAKGKDRALLRLRDELRARGIVEADRVTTPATTPA